MSFIQYAVTLTLVVTGWWGNVIRQLCLRRGFLIRWLTVWFFFCCVQVSLGERWTANLGFCFTLAVLIFGWYKTENKYDAALTRTILCGASFCFFVQELAVLDPALLFVPPYVFQSAALYFFTVALPSIWPRIVCFIGSVQLGYTLWVVFHKGEFIRPSLGDDVFSELLWTSVLTFFVMESVREALLNRWRTTVGPIDKDVT